MAIEARPGTRKASCPSCGGPLRFRGATSIVAVCQYCRATLVREGVKLEDIGKQAQLLEDDTLLCLGAEGTHRGERFSIVGRIQYRYAAGLWNEWHVLFDRGKSAWLSDANRDYTITYLSPPAEVPAFESLKAGSPVVLLGERYTVADVETAEVVAGEGELPFRFAAGWKAPVADLRGPGTRFATIDYSERVPFIYIGERLPFDTFRFERLRDPGQPVEPRARAIAFKCAGCGAPIEKHVATTTVVACGSCGTVTDVTGTVGEAVQRNELNVLQFTPSIPLGSVGRWRGFSYEVVGYMRRRIHAGGVPYEWGEYLAHHVAQGYLWIVEYHGHFSVVKAASDEPKPVSASAMSAVEWRAKLRYLGRDFEHFQRCEPRVSYLVGEFYWRVQLGEQCRVDDYVAPPLILSSETTGKEITWSLGEYVEPDVLWKAFGLKTKPPERAGVAPNQPSPYQGRTLAFWLAFLAFLALGLLIQLGSIALHRTTPPSLVTFTAGQGEVTRTVSPLLDLDSFLGSPLVVQSSTGSRTARLDLDMQLVEAGSGRAYHLTRQMGYHGIGAPLEEGSRDMAEIAQLPGGRYTLTIDARARIFPDPKSRARDPYVLGQVKIYRQSLDWSNFALLAGFLVLWPIVAWSRAKAYEKQRWSESDYPEPATGSGDDGSNDND